EIRIDEVIRAVKSFRSNANDRKSAILHQDGFTDHAAIAPEPAVPKLVAQNHERVFALDPTLIGSEEATGRGLETEHGKHIAADELGPDTLSASANTEVQGTRSLRGGIRNDLLQTAVIQEVPIGKIDGEIDAADLRCQHNQFVGIFGRQRAPQHAIEHAEA